MIKILPFMFEKWGALWISALLYCGILTSSANAQTLNISEDTQMDFATLAMPFSGSEYLTIAANGSGYSGTGTVISGLVSRGSYKIKRQGSAKGVTTITIDVQNIISGSAQLTLDNINGIYGTTTITSFPQGGLPEPGGGQGTLLHLGARATYSPGIAEGQHFPSFDIVVVFD